MDTLVSRLTALMGEHGDDQSSLARKIGCTPAAINQILTGRTQRSRLLPEIADLYDVALPYLLGRHDERGQGGLGDEKLSPDQRRLVRLTDRLAPADRELVYALVSRLAGAAPVVSEGSTGFRSADTMHDQRRDFAGKSEGPAWGE